MKILKFFYLRRSSRNSPIPIEKKVLFWYYHIYLFLHSLAFKINRNLSHTPTIHIHDEDQAFLECKTIKVSLKDLQMWFQEITLDVHRQLTTDLLFGIDTASKSQLTCREFSKNEDYTNKQQGISFLELVQDIALDSSQLELLPHVLSQKLLIVKFVDTQQRWSLVKITAYLRMVH